MGEEVRDWDMIEPVSGVLLVWDGCLLLLSLLFALFLCCSKSSRWVFCVAQQQQNFEAWKIGGV